MCSVSDIPCVGTALNQISEATVGAVKREFCYLYYYKDNVNNLKAKFKQLGIRKEKIDRKVVSAKNDAKTILDHVTEWQNDVEEINGQVAEFLKKYEERSSWRCFGVMRFPNLYSRFRLGREAVKKTERVTELTATVIGDFAVLPPYEPDPMSSTDYMDFESRKDAYNRILEVLEIKDGSPILGIYGMPGVGKTTMMQKACKQAKEKGTFNKVVRANVSELFDLKNVQGQLASRLGLHFQSKANEEERAFQLAIRLKAEEKILVVLDDVWKGIPLDKIGIPFGDGSIGGCKIMLTSRSRDVCVDNNCEDPVLIDTLTVGEAWNLFKKNADSSTIDSLDDESLAPNVCKECERLPLIIAAVGKALRRKPEIKWQDALGQLKNFGVDYIERIDRKVYACLELSFNQLHKDDKLCLMICSMFNEDANIPIEELFRRATGSGLLKDFPTLEDARNEIGAMVANLKSSSLLLEGAFDDTVKLHDIIREVARSLASKDPEYGFLSKYCGSQWPRVDEYSARKLIFLSFHHDDAHADFPDELACPGLHTLVLEQRWYSNRLPSTFFNGCVNLRVLWLKRINICSTPHFGNLANLRTLVLEDCGADFTSLFIPLKNLEMLVLYMSPFAYGGYGPTTLQLKLHGLSRLRMLDLRYCHNRITIFRNSLSSLCNLEELYFPQRFVEVEEEMDEVISIETALSKSTHLKILEIVLKDSMSCPNENICKKLVKFKICFGEFYGEWKCYAKKSLKVIHNSLEGGVKTLVKKGEEVILEHVTGLQNVFVNSDGEAFVDLKWLEISECKGAEHLARWIPLPNDINLHQRAARPFSKLRELKIHSSGFKYLFCASSARCLVQLQKLRVSKCEMMEEIVRNIDQEDNKEILEFPKLIDMDLCALPSLTSFYRNNRNMRTTTTEESTTLHVQSFFNEMVAFPALRELSIDTIVNLRSIFNAKVIFPNLETLDILNMGNVVQIWENQYHTEDRFPRLNIFHVRRCHKLESVIPFIMLTRLQNLKELRVSHCDMIKEIVRNIEIPIDQEDNKEILEFPKLIDIELCALPSLTSFYRNKRNMRTTTTTESTTIHVQSFFNETVVFPALRKLKIECIVNLRSIFNAKVIYPDLETLDINNMRNVVQIWENQYHIEDCFPQLKIFKVSLCHKLESEIPFVMLTRIQSLEELIVSDCDSLISEVKIPDGGARVHGLPRLIKRWLNSSEFSDEITLYPNLTILVINRCNSMRNVFLSSLARELVHLKELDIKDCEMMKSIIATVGEGREEINDDIVFPSLKILRLNELPMLNNFWSDGSLESNVVQTQFCSTHKVNFPILEEFVFHGSRINFSQLNLSKDDLDDDSTFQLRILDVVGTRNAEEPPIIPVDWLLRSQNLEELTMEKCRWNEKELFDFVGQSLRNENHHGILSFRRLRKVSVYDCEVSNLFPCSILRNLQQLQRLEVGSCGSMEEIFVDAWAGEEAATTNHEEISFPHLKSIKLANLPNLKSLCGSANYAFNMPSLQSVYLIRCPKMLNFTFLHTRIPRIKIGVDDYYEWVGPTSDLNTLIQHKF